MINVAARVIAYAKHIVITAFIGLSAQLDAFYMAVTVLALIVFVFGDVFDSVGIPRLVRALQSEGEERFREVAGSILVLACALALGLGLLLLLIAPWTPWIAPGFGPEQKELVRKNLFFLAPMAFLFLPYHAMGSFLRAKRRFQAFYLGEIVIAGVTFVLVLLWHDLPYVLPISFSVAYVFAFVFVGTMARREIRIRFSLRDRNMADIVRMLGRLLPVYLVFHLFTLVDRTFASFLPSGGVSALSYGLLIVMIPPSVFMMENIFVTPLSETEEKGELMRRIVGGVLIIAVPIAVFTAVHADLIVRVAFERGVFTADATRLTGDALTWLGISIPAFFLWPLCYRLFQILGRLRSISMAAFCAVLLNGALNYLFMRLGMGIKGLALATSLANYALVAGAVLLFRREGIHIATNRIFAVLLISIGVAAAALGASTVVPPQTHSVIDLACRGGLFVLVAAVLFLLVPNDQIRYWRKTVIRELFPKWAEDARNR